MRLGHAVGSLSGAGRYAVMSIETIDGIRTADGSAVAWRGSGRVGSCGVMSSRSSSASAGMRHCTLPGQGRLGGRTRDVSA